jgi:hypothetical protein
MSHMGLFCFVYLNTDRFTTLISDSFEYSHSPTYAVVTFRKVRRRSDFAQVGTTRGQLYMYIQRSPVEIHIPAHWNLIRPQHDRFAASVIAQQYSAATFVSLRFHSRRWKFRHAFKKYFNLVLLFWNCISRGLSVREVIVCWMEH